MRKRLYSSSSSSSSELSSTDDDDELFPSTNRLARRTKLSGRYQSEIYTGLVSSNRSYSNGKRLTRLEQLISLYHDDQIRSLLLYIRHYSMKHQWQRLNVYLKLFLQSSFCRAYMRFYWQIIFRYVLETSSQTSSQLDLHRLGQIFENLFHSPTIDRTQTLYSYLCLHLIDGEREKFYIDVETRYKNLPNPFFAGRCVHSTNLHRFDPKFEQLMLIYLHFLYDYLQWLNDFHLNPSTVNPFENLMKTSFENDYEFQLKKFKLTSNFDEIQFITKDYFDNYDTFLLKFLYFLRLTETNNEEIERILQNYVEQHQQYPNVYKYQYWSNGNLISLKKFIEFDPSASPYLLIYCQKSSNAIEILDRLFDYFDFVKNKTDYSTWRFFVDFLSRLDPNDDEIVRCLAENWKIRRKIWLKFHFQCFSKLDSDKAIVAYILIDDELIRMNLFQQFCSDLDQIDQLDLLHQRLRSFDELIEFH